MKKKITLEHLLSVEKQLSGGGRESAARTRSRAVSLPVSSDFTKSQCEQYDGCSFSTDAKGQHWCKCPKSAGGDGTDVHD